MYFNHVERKIYKNNKHIQFPRYEIYFREIIAVSDYVLSVNISVANKHVSIHILPASSLRCGQMCDSYVEDADEDRNEAKN